MFLALRSPVDLSRMGKKSGKSGLVGIAVLLLPMIEVVALIAVGGSLGAFRTIALLGLLSLAGMYIFRSRVSQLASISLVSDAEQQVTPRKIGSAVLAVVGGALMILPGFVTGAAGIALQIAPIRAVLSHLVTSKFTTTVGTVGTRFGIQDPYIQFGQQGFGTRHGDVIDTDLASEPTDHPPSPSQSAELT
ncbi:MAG: FxsA family protein [Acidimicrobiales bacterium]